MKLNPEAIVKIAADVYWTYVYENGIQETLRSISERVPSLMWSMEKAQKVIESYLSYVGIEASDVDSDLLKSYLSEACYEEVLEFILRHAREEKNIIGAIYAEDFADCREANFKYIHLLSELIKDSDENCDYEVVLKGDFPRTGTLLLRTPFPSGVLIRKDESPYQSFMIVEDTIKALGFHKTLVFGSEGIIKLPPNPQQYDYFLTGIFYLPTKWSNDRIWYKLLPNTAGVREGSTFVLPNGDCLSFSIHSEGVGVRAGI